MKPLCCSYYTVCKEYMQDAGFKIVNFFIFWNCVYGTITSRDSIMSRLMNSDDYWMGSLTYYENHCICTWFRNRNLQPPRQNKIGLLFQDFFHTACEGWYVLPYIRSRFIPVYCGHSSHCLVACGDGSVDVSKWGLKCEKPLILSVFGNIGWRSNYSLSGSEVCERTYLPKQKIGRKIELVD